MFVSYFEPEKCYLAEENHMMFASRATTILRRVNLSSFFFQTMKDHGPRKIDLQIKVTAGFSFLNSTIGTCLAGHHIADPIQVDIVQY